MINYKFFKNRELTCTDREGLYAIVSDVIWIDTDFFGIWRLTCFTEQINKFLFIQIANRWSRIGSLTQKMWRFFYGWLSVGIILWVLNNLFIWFGLINLFFWVFIVQAVSEEIVLSSKLFSSFFREFYLILLKCYDLIHLVAHFFFFFLKFSQLLLIFSFFEDDFGLKKLAVPIFLIALRFPINRIDFCFVFHVRRCPNYLPS